MLFYPLRRWEVEQLSYCQDQADLECQTHSKISLQFHSRQKENLLYPHHLQLS